MIPLIAAFPFADSLVIDRKQGYLNQVLARVSFRKYLNAKAIINAMIGGLAAVLPLVLMYIISSSLTTTPLNHQSVDAMALRPHEGFLREMYFNHPDGFLWMILGMVFIVGATFASLGLGASLLVNNRFIALGVSLILFNALQFFAERTRLIPDFLAPLRTLLARSDKIFDSVLTSRFSIVLKESDYPAANLELNCVPDIVLGRISNVEGVPPDYYVIRYEGSGYGKCIIQNGSFEVTINITEHP